LAIKPTFLFQISSSASLAGRLLLGEDCRMQVFQVQDEWSMNHLRLADRPEEQQ
jgi:hypothetical protein